MSKSSAAFSLLIPIALAGCAGSGAAPGAVTDTAPGAPAPRLSFSEVGDSVVYFEEIEAYTLLARGEGDTVRMDSRHHAVIHVVRTAPDTIEGFYEHLVLRHFGAGRVRDLDTEAVRWQRYVLHEEDGRIETLHAPELPREIRQLSDLRRQFEDFFLRTPDFPLAIGSEWADTTRFGTSEGEGSTDRLTVTRYRVRGDTTMHGVPALTIAYETAVESSMRTAPTTQGTLTSIMVGGEEGTIVYSPERRLMLLRERLGVLEGELSVEGSLDDRTIPQFYGYSSRTELLPPTGGEGAAGAAGDAAAGAGARGAGSETPQPVEVP